MLLIKQYKALKSILFYIYKRFIYNFMVRVTFTKHTSQSNLERTYPYFTVSKITTVSTKYIKVNIDGAFGFGFWVDIRNNKK